MGSLVNAISRYMWSHFKIKFAKGYEIKISIIGYSYHSVNVNIFSPAESNHIKRLLL